MPVSRRPSAECDKAVPTSQRRLSDQSHVNQHVSRSGHRQLCIESIDAVRPNDVEGWAKSTAEAEEVVVAKDGVRQIGTRVREAAMSCS